MSNTNNPDALFPLDVLVPDECLVMVKIQQSDKSLVQLPISGAELKTAIRAEIHAAMETHMQRYIHSEWGR